MVKRICDKCGKEIGDNEAFIKIYAPNGNEHSQECIDLCGDCLWKFHDWMKEKPLTKEEIANEAAQRIVSVKSGAKLSDDSDIWDLDLPVRAYNALIKVGCKTVGQLCRMTESDVLGLKGIGKLAVDKIKTSLAELGRSLKKEVE